VLFRRNRTRGLRVGRRQANKQRWWPLANPVGHKLGYRARSTSTTRFHADEASIHVVR
jgi:hypothetical protein